MVGLKLYVEGGGDSKTLRTACRRGFAEFLRKAGFVGRMPRIVACGGRRHAYDDFCTAIRNGESAMLLVDSETPVAVNHNPDEEGKGGQPWAHLEARQGDQWNGV